MLAAHDSAWLIAIAGFASAVTAWRWRGTTLATVWCWQAAALVPLAVVVAFSGSNRTTSTVAWRFVADIALWAPGLAVLGAKRPQHAAWQWIVVTFLIVGTLPAWEVLTVRPAARVELSPLRELFLVVLWLLGWVNFLATRAAPGHAFYAAGQLVLIAEYSNWLPMKLATWDAWGSELVAVGVLLTVGNTYWYRRAASWNAVWSDFRDAYGLVWTLRVAERFQATAVRQNFPIRISWSGIHSSRQTAPGGPTLMANEQRALVALLLRFVDRRWIAARGPASLD